MDPLAELNPVLLSAGILVVVLLLEHNLKWSDKTHPLTLFRILARALGDKAIKPERSATQQKIAGFFAVIVLILPMLILAVTLIMFAEFDWFFDGFFLLIALSYSGVARKYRQINQLLKQDKRALARNQLDTLVLRQTENLSKVGIIKANMETRLLRFHYQYFSVIFWYLFTGGIGALIYRCLFEMAQAWNLKQRKYREFGRSAAWCMLILQWFPVRISSLFFTLSLGLSGSIAAFKKLGGKFSNHSLILAVFGGSLKCELGGPAFYGATKVRLPKVGGETLPGTEDARKLDILLAQHFVILCCAVFLCYLSLYLYVFKS